MADLCGMRCPVWKDAMSDRGAFGRRIPPSRGGDCEERGSRGREKLVKAGELNEDGGPDPDDEYTDTKL